MLHVDEDIDSHPERIPGFYRVRRECNICEELVYDGVPNPFTSIIQRFIISHLSHLEFGLREIIQTSDDITPQDYVIMSLLENVFTIAKMWAPEVPTFYPPGSESTRTPSPRVPSSKARSRNNERGQCRKYVSGLGSSSRKSLVQDGALFQKQILSKFLPCEGTPPSSPARSKESRKKPSFFDRDTSPSNNNLPPADELSYHDKNEVRQQSDSHPMSQEPKVVTPKSSEVKSFFESPRYQFVSPKDSPAASLFGEYRLVNDSYNSLSSNLSVTRSPRTSQALDENTIEMLSNASCSNLTEKQHEADSRSDLHHKNDKAIFSHHCPPPRPGSFFSLEQNEILNDHKGVIPFPALDGIDDGLADFSTNRPESGGKEKYDANRYEWGSRCSTSGSSGLSAGNDQDNQFENSHESKFESHSNERSERITSSEQFQDCNVRKNDPSPDHVNEKLAVQARHFSDSLEEAAKRKKELVQAHIHARRLKHREERAKKEAFERQKKMQREREEKEKEKLEKEKLKQKQNEKRESIVSTELSFVSRPVSARLDDIIDGKGTDDRQFTQDQSGTWIRVESTPVVSGGVPLGSVYPIGQQQRDMKEMQRETGLDKTSSPSHSSNGNSPHRDGASSSDGVDKRPEYMIRMQGLLRQSNQNAAVSAIASDIFADKSNSQSEEGSNSAARQFLRLNSAPNPDTQSLLQHENGIAMENRASFRGSGSGSYRTNFVDGSTKGSQSNNFISSSSPSTQPSWRDRMHNILDKRPAVSGIPDSPLPAGLDSSWLHRPPVRGGVADSSTGSYY